MGYSEASMQAARPPFPCVQSAVIASRFLSFKEKVVSSLGGVLQGPLEVGGAGRQWVLLVVEVLVPRPVMSVP